MNILLRKDVVFVKFRWKLSNEKNIVKTIIFFFSDSTVISTDSIFRLIKSPLLELFQYYFEAFNTYF